METLLATLQPQSAFGGAIRGDTLFGQLCWAVLHRWGEQRLAGLLEGYTQGQPFLVVSDAFPAGYLPRPALPLHRFDTATGVGRKAVKKRLWLPREHFSVPLHQWLHHAVSADEVDSLARPRAQPHNTINRVTGTTGVAEFAPYTQSRQWYAAGALLDLYIAIDASRLDVEELRRLLRDVGGFGYGRDASIGLGKFELGRCELSEWPRQPDADTAMTLAPCAPGGLDPREERCWYQPFTRFGRHGDRAVHSGRPFKTPILMMDTAALLQSVDASVPLFLGRGLGGDGSLSRAIAGTVHQGYAPALALRMEERT